MSNTLLEKRAELSAKCAELENARKAEIEAKVDAYRQTLESTTPTDAIDKVKNVILALDEVIAYENIAHGVHYREAVDTESVVHNTSSARPGMSSVVSPR